MKKIKYPLIISDCDGTLITDEQKILPEVRSAVNEYTACGGIFAVITGRMPSTILPKVRSLGLKGLVAGYQGTVIADIESGRYIRKDGFDYSQSLEICRAFSSADAGINLYIDDTLYTERAADDELLSLYCKITGAMPRHLQGETAEQFVNRTHPYCQKIAALVVPEERDALYGYLKRVLGDKYDVTYSAAILVEVSPVGDNKGTALRYMAEHYGIDVRNTVAVGDNLNDLPMIEAAGVGIAVGNAVKPLKDAADVVTVTNNEGAVAKVIAEYGFE